MKLEDLKTKIVTRIGVTAYDAAYAGYGDNRSREGFATEEEAIAYAKSCPPSYGARAWKRTTVEVEPQSETLWSADNGTGDL